ncbi:MAG TPA: FAD-dependent oxidoreductase [Verrucomicrobiales bacterium]|nr:FAD-dependent oxidoreductase [Verrucomicrobiales bacterium]
MNRRTFLKLSGSGLFSSLVSCRQPDEINLNFPVQIQDDLLRGHRLFNGPKSGKFRKEYRKDVLVVGAGISGLASAYQLRSRDAVVIEIGNTIGGSSASGDYKGIPFSMGAHYDLEYPDYYGRETLELLVELGVIRLNPVRRLWEFVDRQFLIEPDEESQCRVRLGFRSEVLPDTPQTLRFIQWIQSFSGSMPMPTRLISPEFRELNFITFAQLLKKEGIDISAEFRQAIDYQLTDDYGAGMDQVSALAGIHYYQCRPYYSESIQVFSPPQGNAYFADKLLGGLPPDTVRLNSLVKSILPESNRFKVQVLDLITGETDEYRVSQVVYAGHKQGLKYSLPEEYPRFSETIYAPWLVFNFILNRPTESKFWQNEMPVSDSGFLGVVNSQAQYAPFPNTSLGAYFCLSPDQRASLLEIHKNSASWLRRVLSLINQALDERIDQRILQGSIRVLGHAMPIPVPGYLFQDRNDQRKFEGLVYAGVDNGRLPLMFEALDSGILAASLLS